MTSAEPAYTERTRRMGRDVYERLRLEILDPRNTDLPAAVVFDAQPSLPEFTIPDHELMEPGYEATEERCNQWMAEMIERYGPGFLEEKEKTGATTLLTEARYLPGPERSDGLVSDIAPDVLIGLQVSLCSPPPDVAEWHYAHLRAAPEAEWTLTCWSTLGNGQLVRQELPRLSRAESIMNALATGTYVPGMRWLAVREPGSDVIRRRSIVDGPLPEATEVPQVDEPVFQLVRFEERARDLPAT